MDQLLINNEENNQRHSSDIIVRYNSPSCINDAYTILQPTLGQNWDPNGFIAMISSAEHIFCAYDSEANVPIACAVLDTRDQQAQGGIYLKFFGVLPSYQGRGIGTDVLEAVIYWAHKNGYRMITLNVNDHNQTAMSLYQKLGFQPTQYIYNYYDNTDKTSPNAYFMVLQLN